MLKDHFLWKTEFSNVFYGKLNKHRQFSWFKAKISSYFFFFLVKEMPKYLKSVHITLGGHKMAKFYKGRGGEKGMAGRIRIAKISIKIDRLIRQIPKRTSLIKI